MTKDVVLPKGWIKTTLENVANVHDNLREPINAEERAKRAGPLVDRPGLPLVAPLHLD